MILHMRTKNLDDMIYSCWDIEWDRLKLVIMSHFLPFYPLPPKNPKNQNFEKMKKIARDIIILHMCIKNDNHMRYGFWDMEWEAYFFVILDHFCPLTLLTGRKIKILKIEKNAWRLLRLTCWFVLEWVTQLPCLFWVSFSIQFCLQDLPSLAFSFWDHRLSYLSMSSLVYLVYSVPQLLVLLYC